MFMVTKLMATATCPSEFLPVLVITCCCCAGMILYRHPSLDGSLRRCFFASTTGCVARLNVLPISTYCDCRCYCYCYHYCYSWACNWGHTSSLNHYLSILHRVDSQAGRQCRAHKADKSFASAPILDQSKEPKTRSLCRKLTRRSRRHRTVPIKPLAAPSSPLCRPTSFRTRPRTSMPPLRTSLPLSASTA